MVDNTGDLILCERTKLAVGSYGMVYSAKSNQTGIKYAVKRLLVSKHINFCASVREFDIVKRVQHPYVVRCFGLKPILEIFEDRPPSPLVGDHSRFYKDDVMVQVYELYSGSLLSCRPHSDRLIFFLLRTLVGLEFIHGQGVSHGDLSVRNILVDHLGRPKIADFGLARHAYLSRIDREPRCTLPYRAPSYKNITNKWHDNRNDDIWSFGCLAHELLYEISIYGKDAHMVIKDVESLEEQQEYLFGYKSGIKNIPETIKNNELLLNIFVPNNDKRPNATELINSQYFKHHISPQDLEVVKKIRATCPAYSSSLQTCKISDNPIRKEIGKYIRKILTKNKTSEEFYPLAFHSIELVDRLCDKNYFNEDHKISNIMLLCMYLTHKLIEDEPTSFKEFIQKNQLEEFINETRLSQRRWEDNEIKILKTIDYEIYAPTPYECYIEINGVINNFEELNRLLVTYSRFPSGSHHVRDIVHVSNKLPIDIA